MYIVQGHGVDRADNNLDLAFFVDHRSILPQVPRSQRGRSDVSDAWNISTKSALPNVTADSVG